MEETTKVFREVIFNDNKIIEFSEQFQKPFEKESFDLILEID